MTPMRIRALLDASLGVILAAIRRPEMAKFDPGGAISRAGGGVKSMERRFAAIQLNRRRCKNEEFRTLQERRIPLAILVNLTPSALECGGKRVRFDVMGLMRRRSKMVKTPIMSADQERFMAFGGLVQWTQAVITQCQRVSGAMEAMRGAAAGHQALLAFHSECHFFVIAAYKLIEYRKWVSTFVLCAGVDFSEIDGFSEQDIRDLRKMREHVVEYFQGGGHASDRWFIETPEFKADASSVINTMIGGRLDWIKFAAAAERLLPKLLAGPIPYPPR